MDLYIGGRTTGPIFLDAKGERMDRYAADRMVKRLARRAGITKRTARSACATPSSPWPWIWVPLRDVQEAASHADPRTTMRYEQDRHATYVVAAFSSAPRAEPDDGY